EIARGPNRTYYNWTDADLSLVAGNLYWYQVRWTDTQGREHMEPAFQVKTQVKPTLARVMYSITHESLDNDASVRFGTAVSPASPAFVRAGGGRPAADFSKVIAPGVGDGFTEYFFHVDLTADDLVSGFLPPSAANPWFLEVAEEGYLNTSGIVDSF